MPPNVAEVEEQALQLLPEDRARPADKLLSSLGVDPTVEAAWGTEVDRRLSEFESGAVVGIPVEESLARARAAIR